MMPDSSLDIDDHLPRIELVPPPIQILSDGPQLDDEVIATSTKPLKPPLATSSGSIATSAGHGRDKSEQSANLTG
jgi:hypothetical protein